MDDDAGATVELRVLTIIHPDGSWALLMRALPDGGWRLCLPGWAPYEPEEA